MPQPARLWRRSFPAPFLCPEPRFHPALERLVRHAANGEYRLGQAGFFQGCLFKLQIEFCHCGPPENHFWNMLLYHGRSTILTSRQVILSSPPRLRAASIRESQASSSIAAELTILSISSSRTYFVNPSEVIRRTSPASATRSSTSGCTSSSEPSARKIIC